jgi:secreted PhoX family phosphatase
VTRLVVDATTKERVSSNLVLVGTAQNCSGGPSPWGWLSCEENVDPTHGYVFVCPTDAATVRAPEPVPAYGRYRHEAVAIDPATNTAYLTEDRSDSVFYRFVPTNPAAPFTGKLQALAVPGKPLYFQTVTGLSVGDVLDVAWVDLSRTDRADDTLRYDARDHGAAMFSRGEGIWFNQGVVYFTCTDGGPARSGQVFALRPTANGGTLSLVAQSENPASLDGPDNLTMSPWGDLLVAEDSVNGNSDNFVRCLTPSGTFWDLARTTLSELSGLCFSPDGRALFVNIFGADMTVVIRGPFPTSDPGGGGGQGGESGGSGGSNGGQAGEPSGGEANGGAGGGAAESGAAGASDDGGAGSGSGTGGASTGGSSNGGASSSGASPGGSFTGGASTGGASGSGGASAGSSRRPSSDTKDDPGCGCEIPGKRR